MNVSIGINPITWSNDDLPQVGGDISLETCLRDAAAAGYEGIELGGKFPRDANELGPLLERHGLSLVSGWYSGHLLEQSVKDEAATMKGHLNLLKQMGCNVLIFAEVTSCVHSDKDARVSRRPRLSHDQARQFAERLSELAKMTADDGVMLNYHHHMGTVVQSADDIDQLMEAAADQVQLLLDTGHALYAGADPSAIAKKYASRIGHVHCKDVRPAVLERSLNNDCSFLTAVLNGVFTVPGDGCVDYSSVLAIMKEADYEGWLVVEAEQDPSVAPPAHYANLGCKNLHSLIASL
jgi:inosose dehydratase